MCPNDYSLLAIAVDIERFNGRQTGFRDAATPAQQSMQRQPPLRILWRNVIDPLKVLHVMAWLVSLGSKCGLHHHWTAGAFDGVSVNPIVCLIAAHKSASVSSR